MSDIPVSVMVFAILGVGVSCSTHRRQFPAAGHGAKRWPVVPGSDEGASFAQIREASEGNQSSHPNLPNRSPARCSACRSLSAKRTRPPSLHASPVLR
jgi:hypothetical protein